MLYIAFIFTVAISYTIGYVVGYAVKVHLMDGDICIACDSEDGEVYPFLRLNGSIEDISSKDLVSFKVVKVNRDKNSL